MNIKNLKIGDIIQAFESDEANGSADIKPTTGNVKLPRPTHDPYAGPYIVYGFELEDPNLRIPLPSGTRRKLH